MTHELAKALKVKGLLNIQYIIYEEKLYVIEVNPRASRTVPYISKVTGVPFIDLATRCGCWERKSQDMGYGDGALSPEKDTFAVKVPVFSFEKLPDVEVSLGPEMKSTGEVLGAVYRLRTRQLFKGYASRSGIQRAHTVARAR